MGQRQTYRSGAGSRTRPDLGLAAFVALVGLTLASLLQVIPSAAVPAGAPLSLFAAGRAMEHVHALGRRPRPPGSEANAEARAYLVARLQELGLAPEMETAPVNDGDMHAATVNNVIARLAGTGATGSLLIVAHYASTRITPDASGSASVATVLEVLRALRTGTPLDGDVIVLFADGDADNLLGVRAFLQTPPWQTEVGAVIHVAARGAGGPVVIFEAPRPGGPLIDVADPGIITPPFARGQQRRPDDPGTALFELMDVPGVSIVHGGRWPAHGNRLDTVEHLDPRSLQHQGDATLALVRRLAKGDQKMGSVRPAITLAGHTIHFPAYSAWQITGALTVGFILTVVGGMWRRLLGLRAIFAAALTGLLIVGAGTLASTLALIGAGALWAEAMRTPTGATHGSHVLAMSAVALAVGVVSSSVTRLRRRISLFSFAGGTTLLWLSLLHVAMFQIPALAPLLQVTVLGGIATLSLLCLVPRSWLVATQFAAGLVVAAPAALLWTPQIYLWFEWLPVESFGMIAGAVALLLLLGLPLLDLSLHFRGQWVPGLAGAATVGLLLWSGVTAGFSAERPRFNTIFYTLDTDSGTAFWGSLDRETDEWTTLFLTDHPRSGVLSDALPLVDTRPILTAPAPALELAPATARIEDDSIAGDVRTVSLRVVPPEGVRTLVLDTGSGTRLRAAAIDDKVYVGATEQGRLQITYHNTPATGVLLRIEFDAATALVLHVAAIRDGLPAIEGEIFAERPGDMAATDPLDSSTIVRKSYSIRR